MEGDYSAQKGKEVRNVEKSPRGARRICASGLNEEVWLKERGEWDYSRQEATRKKTEHQRNGAREQAGLGPVTPCSNRSLQCGSRSPRPGTVKKKSGLLMKTAKADQRERGHAGAGVMIPQ